MPPYAPLLMFFVGVMFVFALYQLMRIASALELIASSVTDGNEPRPSTAKSLSLKGTPEPGLYRATEDDLAESEARRQRLLDEKSEEDGLCQESW